MGILGRKAGASKQAMDDAIPFLSASDADRLRSLVADEFRGRGLDVVVRADHVDAGDQGAYGLWNLAATCHAAEDDGEAWPEIVRLHVSAVLAPDPDVDALSDADLLASVFARVYGIETLPEDSRERLTYGRPLADGLVELLVHDDPQKVVTIMDDQLAKRDSEVLWAAARARTKAVKIEEVEWVDIKGQGKIAVALGESVYTASRILDAPSLLERIYGERPFIYGAVFAVPNRHQIVAYPLDDLGAIRVIPHVAQLAVLGYQDGAGSVSPYAYWWDGTRFERISDVSDGSMTILSGPELTGVLNVLPPR